MKDKQTGQHQGPLVQLHAGITEGSQQSAVSMAHLSVLSNKMR